jgi:hypothetical protein
MLFELFGIYGSKWFISSIKQHAKLNFWLEFKQLKWFLDV